MEKTMTRISLLQISFVRTSLLSKLSLSFLLLLVWVGCGGSSVSNTVGSEENISSSGELNVQIETDHTTVSPGETIDLAVTFDSPVNTQIRIAWLNVTGYGKLADKNTLPKVSWTAPKELNSLESIEIVHVIVTGVKRAVSEDGLDARTQILTETKTILLTVTGL